MAEPLAPNTPKSRERSRELYTLSHGSNGDISYSSQYSPNHHQESPEVPRSSSSDTPPSSPSVREKEEPRRKTSSSSILAIDKSSIKKLSVHRLIESNPLALFTILKTASADEEDLGIAVASIFCGKPQAVRLVLFSIQTEINNTSEYELLLRGSGVTTRLLSTLGRLTGVSYLKNVLSPIIRKVISEKKIEINPSRLTETDDAQQNAQNLCNICHFILDSLKQSVADMPSLIATICYELYKATESKFVNHGEQALGGYFILRVICPALTMPEKYDLAPDCSVDLRRKLILVAKVIQAVFNQTIEDKEEWMQLVLPFVQSSKHVAVELSSSIQQRIDHDETFSKRLTKQISSISLPKSALSTASDLVNYFVNKHLEELTNTTQKMVDSQIIPDEHFYSSILSKEADLVKSSPQEIDFVSLANMFLVWLNSQKKRGPSLTHDHDVYAELLSAPSDPDDYNTCILRVTSESKKMKVLTVERDGMTVEWIAAAVKDAFKKVERVEYLKDGEKIILDKTTWNDFLGSALIQSKTAIFRLFLTRRNAPALSKYMDKL